MMKQKVLLTREDGYDHIFLKVFDENGELLEEEYSITYEEWDKSEKEKIGKNLYMLQLGDEQQQERIEWLLGPERMVTILIALNPEKKEENKSNLSFMFRFGSISTEYCERFSKTMFDFIKDIEIAKEVFQIMISKQSKDEPNETAQTT